MISLLNFTQKFKWKNLIGLFKLTILPRFLYGPICKNYLSYNMLYFQICLWVQSFEFQHTKCKFYVFIMESIKKLNIITNLMLKYCAGKCLVAKRHHQPYAIMREVKHGYIHVPILYSEHNHYVLKACTNKVKKWFKKRESTNTESSINNWWVQL